MGRANEVGNVTSMSHQGTDVFGPVSLVPVWPQTDESTRTRDGADLLVVQEALERLMANRTSFVIAHRLSTIRKADQILVMRHGQIIERGTHEELLAADGLYSRLARIQGTTFIEESFEKLSVSESA